MGFPFKYLRVEVFTHDSQSEPDELITTDGSSQILTLNLDLFAHGNEICLFSTVDIKPPGRWPQSNDTSAAPLQRGQVDCAAPDGCQHNEKLSVSFDAKDCLRSQCKFLDSHAPPADSFISNIRMVFINKTDKKLKLLCQKTCTNH